MRNEFSDFFLNNLAARSDQVFITGDLGFGALEKIRDVMEDRFINAGVAEQNMVSVAAGLSSEGYSVWVYSIAPFIYARAFEQIRNDVAFHESNVRFVGNGGGFGYGVMGPSHLSFDDYGVIGSALNLKIFLPTHLADVRKMTEQATAHDGPVYLRLSSNNPRIESESDYHFDSSGFCKVSEGEAGVIVSTAPLVQAIVKENLARRTKLRYEVWSVNILPIQSTRIPTAITSAGRKGRLFVAEEHVWHGGVGMQLFGAMAQVGKAHAKLNWRGVPNRPMRDYGSADFLRRQLGLDPVQILDWCDLE